MADVEFTVNLMVELKATGDPWSAPSSWEIAFPSAEPVAVADGGLSGTEVDVEEPGPSKMENGDDSIAEDMAERVG